MAKTPLQASSQLDILRTHTIEILQKALPGRQTVSTAEIAKALGVMPGTPRRAFCTGGHWQGLIPMKAPNGRLIWPIAQ